MNTEFTSYPGTVFRLVVVRDGKDEFWYVTNNWVSLPFMSICAIVRGGT
jgi:hypothetical protein